MQNGVIPDMVYKMRPMWNAYHIAENKPMWKPFVCKETSVSNSWEEGTKQVNSLKVAAKPCAYAPMYTLLGNGPQFFIRFSKESMNPSL